MDRRAMLPRGRLIKIMLACGALHICAYYGAATWATPGSHLAVPQPDTLLYCQSARQIAEGMPYQFTPGEKPSTGCTSHVYPFLLAGLYKAGATGDALLTAGFALNALFYLIFLVNWGVIAGRLTTSHWARGMACALLVTSGHAAFGALSQSDVGLFMALSSGVLAALLTGRTGWLAALLILGPWCRPEGVVLALLYAGAVMVRRWALGHRVSAAEWWGAALSVVSAIGVFAFNDWLTGYAQFQSVYYKGYFKQNDFLSALYFSLGDAVQIGKELFLGQPGSLSRDVVFIPFLGALFAWFGVFMRPWRSEHVWKEVWWLLACAAGLGVVASSGWQSTNMGRYFVWLLPIWLVYMAEGMAEVGRRLPARACRQLPFLVAVIFQVAGAFWLITTYYSACLNTQQRYDFAKGVNEWLPSGARLGGGGCSLAYALPKHRYLHLSGLFSPDMFSPDTLLNVERLKNQSGLRFDYWVLDSGQAELLNTKIDALCGPILTIDMNEVSLRGARWEALDKALWPVGDDTVAQLEGWQLVDRLDVGYAEDEKRCGYTAHSRFHGTVLDAFARSGQTGTNVLFEVGRAVIGWETLAIRTEPNKPVKVVLRTAAKVETGARTGVQQKRQTFTFGSPVKLRVHVDKVEVGVFELPLSEDEAAFSEVAFDLPAETIRDKVTRLTVFGDHAALGYWFYQPAQ